MSRFMVVVLQRRRRRRVRLVAHRRVDRLQRERAVAGEILHRLAVAGRVDDGDDVVGADVALDELPRRGARARRAVEAGVADRRGRGRRRAPRTACGSTTTSGGMAVFEKSGGSTRSIGMSTIENAVSACGLPSSTIWKSSLVSVADEVALRVGDVGVDLDVVDFDLEGDGRLLSALERGAGAGVCASTASSMNAMVVRINVSIQAGRFDYRAAVRPQGGTWFRLEGGSYTMRGARCRPVPPEGGNYRIRGACGRRGVSP